MEGADVKNANFSNVRDQRASGTVRYNKPRVWGIFPWENKIELYLYYTPSFTGMSSVGSGADVELLH